VPITRRRFLTAASSSLAALSVLRPASLMAGAGLQAAAPTVTPVFKEVRGGVGIFTARGGTIGYYSTADAFVVVDTQFPDTAQMFWDGVKHTRPKIDVLVNTHHHGDHTAGNKVLGPQAKQIVAHPKVPELQRAAAGKSGSSSDQVYATTLAGTTWNESVGRDLEISTRHYGPAHTGGDLVVFFEQPDVVHMGDLVFNRSHPFIDRPAGASIANWILVCERVTRDHGAGTLYIFGHGKDGAVVGKREDLLLERDYLTALLDTARKAVAAGQSKEELQRLTALPGFPEHVGLSANFGLGMPLGVAYDEASAK
jgi:glyoxylase-like metal-dependent hydrolase (beta-lactamase superfamily II)